jgi:uncharacterized protein
MRRHVYQELCKRMKEKRTFIQVLLGPRQVGKTSLVLDFIKESKKPCHYATADSATLEDITWIRSEWEIARSMEGKEGIFIIDEVQKIPNWSSVIKDLWDEDTRKKTPLKVIILGSSPWLMSRGLSESLAGRFEIIPMTHWSFKEMRSVFDWDLDRYLFYGGYPGAAPLLKRGDDSRWRKYINDALIETTVSRDILLMTQINKPVLLRRLFQLGCIYSGQIFSFTKILGQLLDAGNTTTLAHYLELLQGVGLVAGIQKLSKSSYKVKSSSPKFQVFNTALMTAQSTYSFQEAKNDPAIWGRIVESAVGAYLLNSIRETQIELFYWNEGQNEVDFVLKQDEKLVAIEVASGQKPHTLRGLKSFSTQYPDAKILIIGQRGISVERFLLTPITKWFT